MLLHEANARLKTPITEEQLWDIHNLYCVLDLDKDDFCTIVDAVGVETLIAKKSVYDLLYQRKIHLRNEKMLCHEQEMLRTGIRALLVISNALLEGMQDDGTIERTTEWY